MAIGARDEQIDVLESRLASILSQLDVKLSALQAALQGEGGKTLTDVEAAIAALRAGSETLQSIIDAISGLKGGSDKDLTTLESDVENIYSKLNSQLNITLSALRDALRGSSTKDFTTLEADVESVYSAVKGQRASGASGQVSVGTGGAQLPAHAVAPGCKVAVWADPDNSDKVAINIGAEADPTSHALLGPGQGLTLAVSDTDLIYLKASSGTQIVHWIVET